MPGVKTTICDEQENLSLIGAAPRPVPAYYTLSLNNDPDFQLLANPDGSFPATPGYYNGMIVPDPGLTQITEDAEYDDPENIGTILKIPLTQTPDFYVDPNDSTVLQVAFRKNVGQYILGKMVNRIAVYTAEDILIYIAHFYPMVWGDSKIDTYYRHQYLSSTTLEAIASGDIDKVVLADIRIEAIAENIAKLQGLMVDHTAGTILQKSQLEATDLISDLDTLSGQVHILDGSHATGTVTITDVEFSFATLAYFDLGGGSTLTLAGNTKGKIRVINADDDSVIITGSSAVVEVETDNENCVDLSQLVGVVTVNGRAYKGTDAAKVQELARKNDVDAVNSKISVSASSSNRAPALSEVEDLLASLVDSSPEALDTLNELAAALGDDENFSATVITLISDEVTARTNEDTTLQENIDVLSIQLNPISFPYRVGSTAEVVSGKATNTVDDLTGVPDYAKIIFLNGVHSPTANIDLSLKTGLNIAMESQAVDLDLNDLYTADFGDHCRVDLNITDAMESGVIVSGTGCQLRLNPIACHAYFVSQTGTGNTLEVVGKYKNDAHNVGDMWTRDGNWVDDKTIPGCFACIPGNDDQAFSDAHGGVKCHNMVDEFVKGGTSAGGIGGANNYTLTIAQLPSHTHSTPSHTHTTPSHTHTIAHTHSVNHNHGSQTFGSSAISTTHRHGASTKSTDGWLSKTTSYHTNFFPGMSINSGSATTQYTGYDGAHTHTTVVDINNYAGTSGASSAASSGASSGTTGSKSGTSGSTGSGSVISNEPSYYTLIYIKRVA